MVFILNRKENRVVVGTLLVDRGVLHRYSTLVPRDCRIPRLLIDTSIWPSPIHLRDGTKESKELFYALLPSWENFKLPKGYIIVHLQIIMYGLLYFVYTIMVCRILKGVLGESGEINTETEGILIAHDIQERPYPEDIDQYFPPQFSVEDELKYRKDFRYFTCSHKFNLGI